jgi:hypothetical protein
MKQYEKIQLLIEDLEKEKRKLDLAIEDANCVINSTDHKEWYKVKTEEYKRSCLSLRSDVVVEIENNKQLLKMMGFDFGKLWSIAPRDLVKFEHWFSNMIREVK